MSRRKRPSRRRIRARFMLGRRVALQDVYERSLIDLVARVGYEVDGSAFIVRKRPVVHFTVEEYSQEQIRELLYG